MSPSSFTLLLAFFFYAAARLLLLRCCLLSSFMLLLAFFAPPMLVARDHADYIRYLAEQNQQTCHQAVWECLSESHPQISPSRLFLCRTDAYSSLLDKSDMSVRQSGDVFPEVIFSSFLL